MAGEEEGGNIDDRRMLCLRGDGEIREFEGEGKGLFGRFDIS